MKQREKQAQSGAAEALQFLDESPADRAAQNRESPAPGELMAEELADDAEPYDDAAYDDSYDDAYDDYPDDDHHDTYEERSEVEVVAAGDSGFSLMWLAGVGLALAGVALMVAWKMAGSVAAIAGIQELFSGLGLAPIDVVLLGVVLAGLARIKSHLQRHDAEVVSALQGSRSGGVPEDLQSQIAYLVEAASSSGGEGGGPSSQDLQRTLHLMKRQEEKINNLSKATKMYGKPLIEITNQMSESTHQLADISTRLDAVKIIAEQSANRLETTLRTELEKKGGGGDTSGLSASIQATRDTVKALEALQRDLSQRLTDKTDKLTSELVNALRETRTELQSALRESKGELQSALRESKQSIESLQDGLQQGLQHGLLQGMQQGLEQAQTTIVEKIQGIKLPEPAAAAPAVVETPKELTAAIAKIEQQLSSLAHTVSNLGTVSAAAPAPAPPPAQKSKKAAKAAAEPEPEADGSSSSPTGQGKSSSNVMSAIAKLKQLRT